MSKRTIGPFQLERQLGVGGMGIVYLARYAKNGQLMALKVLSPGLSANKQLVARFEREMEILKRLRHPNIVTYYGGGKAGAQQFYAMELMDGGSLEGLLKEKKRLSWEQAIEYGIQICSALEHAHNHGIVHRDLKPANLFITKDGRLKLGDFGIARDTEATALTAAGRTVGTYAYMAPEQISGKPPVSRKTDLYALGCVLFEMLTGRTPFEADAPPEMMMQHLQDEPPRVTAFALDCPVWLEAVITKLLEKDPEERYYDALAAQVALREVGRKVAEQTSLAKQTVAGGSSSTRQAGASELGKLLGRTKKKRKKTGPFYEQVWFLASCLVLLVAGVTWAMWPLNEEQLFARAQVLMQSDDAVARQDAQRKYLEPLLARFPEGRHVGQAREWIDEIEADRTRRQVETSRRLGREPKSEAERLFIEARNFEEFGDRLTARERYRAMIELLKDREEDRPYVNLARQQLAAIQEKGTDDDRLQVIMEALRRGDEFMKRGRKQEAWNEWDSVILLYSAHQEFEPLVRYARARRSGREVDPLDFNDPDFASTEDEPDASPDEQDEQ